MRRVVVTGLGLISPVGNTVTEGWANLLAGRSGIANITKFDAAGFSCRFAGEVKGFEPTDWIPKKKVKEFCRFSQLSIAASQLCMKDAGIELRE